MIVETGKLSTFTVIRETSLEKWFYKRYIAMVISSFTYIALAIILTTFLGFNKSLQLHQFFSFALLFSAHILLLISASVATLLIFRSAKAVLILYLNSTIFYIRKKAFIRQRDILAMNMNCQYI